MDFQLDGHGTRCVPGGPVKDRVVFEWALLYAPGGSTTNSERNRTDEAKAEQMAEWRTRQE